MQRIRKRLQPALLAGFLVCAALIGQAQAPPDSGPVEILPLDQITKGMKATAWTVFEGSTAEPVPIEILGLMKNAWGPKQDIILAKMGGKALRTNVAAGMSGSPVYHEGKLLGAVALRFSTFSPDAVAGITPIELMLEIDELDRSLPTAASVEVPGRPVPKDEPLNLAQAVWDARDAQLPDDSYITPIETPLTFSGVPSPVLDLFGGYFRQSGIVPVQGGAVSASASSLGDSAGTLKPGEPIAAVLMSGDMSAVGLGTVSYNDGNRVLGFGHAMFNSGPVEMPIATADVLLVLASQLNPAKISNAAKIVGALRQDRHSGIMGVLGETARMIPVDITVRNFDEGERELSSKHYNISVFRNQLWTPQLLMLSVYSSIFNVNEVSQETTYRLRGEATFEDAPPLELRSLQSVSSGPMPAPLQLAAALAGKMRQVLNNPLEMPDIDNIEVEVDMLPGRRIAAIEHATVDKRVVRAGDTISGKVFLRRYRGERVERDFQLDVPAGTEKGVLRIVVGDATLPNRMRQAAAARHGLMTLEDTVRTLNQERTNDTVYVSLSRRAPTAYVDDQTLPNAPKTLLNVMGPTAGRRLLVSAESALAETEIRLDSVISGNIALTVEVQ